MNWLKRTAQYLPYSLPEKFARHTQFTDYLKEYDHLLTRHQSVNRSNHSTETLNILVSDFVLSASNCKQIAVLELVEFKESSYYGGLTVVSSCMNMLLQVNSVRHLFTQDFSAKIIKSLIFSKLYYFSS